MALTTIPVELVTLDDGVTISTADNDAQLILVSTDADANIAPLMQFYRNSSSPADNDQTGRIEFNARNDNSQDVNYATVVTQIVDASDGAEDGRFAINTMVAGTSQSRIDIRASETVINNESIDVDFRIEGNGQANLFVVNAGTDDIGIGMSDPTFATGNGMQFADDFYLGFGTGNGTRPDFTIHGDNNGLGIACGTGADTVDVNIDTAGNLSATKLTSNNGVLELDDNGSHNGVINVPASLFINIDSDGNSSGEDFIIGKDRTSTSGGTELFRVDESGRVGIGTDSARSLLDVKGDHAAGYIITAQNDGNNINRYGIKIIAGSDDSSGTSYLLDFFDGDGTNVGSVTNAGGTVSYGPFTAHHPCVIPDEDNKEDSTENSYPYGTLLETTSLSYSKNSDDSDTERGIIYNVQKSSGAYSRKVLGAYGNSMNQGPEEETNKHQALILGDGHILCNNEKGNISVGDGICTSSTAGIGMKADKMAMIIGIAQEDVTFSGSETKLVTVQYGLQQFTPWTD